MTRSALASLVALTTFALAASGCDLFDPGGPAYAGVVVDAETQVPIEGIQVSLQKGYPLPVVVAEDLTDAAGRFSVQDPLNRASRATLYANSPGYVGDQPSPHTPLYDGFAPFYDYDERGDLRIELRRLP